MQGSDRAEHLLLRVAEVVDLRADRRLHREQRERLEQVVLHHVAERTHLLVELPSPLHAEVLGHRDLHLPHEVAVPDRLEEGVGEAEVEDVLDRLLPQVVVDPEDARLGEHRVKDAVELLRRLQVAPERLLDDDAGVLRAVGRAEALDDRGEEARRDREVVRGALRAAEGLTQRLEGGLVAVVPVDVAHELREPAERALVVDTTAVRLDAVAGPVAQLLHRPRRGRDADHGHAQLAPLEHVVERREDLLVGQVARRAEEHQRVGRGGLRRHVFLLLLLLVVAAELLAHRREDLVGEVGLAP